MSARDGACLLVLVALALGACERVAPGPAASDERAPSSTSHDDVGAAAASAAEARSAVPPTDARRLSGSDPAPEVPPLTAASPAGAAAARSPSARVPAPLDGAALIGLVASLPAPRAPGSAQHAATAELLERWLTPLGLTLLRQPFTWAGRPGVTAVNLETRLPGATADAPLLVACAHYDTVAWGPGADDNGSGVVALMALARRLAPRPLAAEVALVWFDEEETGFAGSRRWLEALSDRDRQRLVGVVNLETVGFTDRRPGGQSLPPGAELLLDPGDVGDFVLLLANQSSADFAATVQLGLGAFEGPSLRVEAYTRLPGQGWVLPDSRRSDHASFWDAGVPAVLLTDTANFRNPNYHRRSDLASTLDGDFLSALVQGVERALILLSEE